MEVVVSPSVWKFIKKLDAAHQSEAHRLIYLLKDYGYGIAMPHAKPIGGGMHELRSVDRPAIRLRRYC